MQRFAQKFEEKTESSHTFRLKTSLRRIYKVCVFGKNKYISWEIQLKRLHRTCVVESNVLGQRGWNLPFGDFFYNWKNNRHPLRFLV